MMPRRLPRNSRKLLVAAIGVAAVSFGCGEIADQGDAHPTSGNLMGSNYDASPPPTSGNLMGPDPDAGVFDATVVDTDGGVTDDASDGDVGDAAATDQ